MIHMTRNFLGEKQPVLIYLYLTSDGLISGGTGRIGPVS